MRAVAIVDPESGAPEAVGARLLGRVREVLRPPSAVSVFALSSAGFEKPPRTARELRAAIPATRIDALWIVGRRLGLQWGLRDLAYFEPVDGSQPAVVIIPSPDPRSAYWGKPENHRGWARYLRAIAV